MSKEVLALDVDEVLFPMLHHFIADYNGRYGTDHKLEHFDSYEFERVLNISVPETVERVFAFIGSNHSHIDPIEGTQDAIDRLSRKYDLEVITARDQIFDSSTTAWIEEKVSKVFKNINFVGYAPIKEKPITKAEVCLDIGAIAMIDDSLPYLKQCVEVGVDGILFGDYPWNQVENLPAGITRLENWQAVAEYFGV